MEAEIAVVFDMLRNAPLFIYLVALASVALIAISIVSDLRANKKDAQLDEETPEARTAIDHPVIGYKTANIESIDVDVHGNIADIVFKGLVGYTYPMTGKTERSGIEKFNSYAAMDKALVHAQNWGSTLLEVVGYGEVEEHEHGYTSQKQRVLQVAFMECSRHYQEKIKCDNEPVFFATPEPDEKRYLTYCAGCVSKASNAMDLSPFLSRSYVLKNGETLVVAAASTREHVNIVPTVLPEKEGGKNHGDI